jgi:hypothetical protein
MIAGALMFSFVLAVGAAGAPVAIVPAGTLHHSGRHPLDLPSGFFAPAVAETSLFAHVKISALFWQFTRRSVNNVHHA